VFIGKTGAGKSKIIENITVNTNYAVTGISGSTLESTTKQTNFYVCDNCTFVDTPGLGDSEGKDQIFLDQFIGAMQDHCTGVHRIYYVFKVHENKFDESMQNSFKILKDMIPKFNNKVIKFIVTHCDEKKNFEESRQKWILLLKTEIKLNVEILACGDNMMNEIVHDILAINQNEFIQTEFMKKVETQKQKLLNTENELKKNMSTMAETLQHQIWDLEQKLSVSETPQDKIKFLSEMVSELKHQLQVKDNIILRLQETKHDLQLSSMQRYYELQNEMMRYQSRNEEKEKIMSLKDEKMDLYEDKINDLDQQLQEEKDKCIIC